MLHLQRRSFTGVHSVERLFDDVRTAMPPDIHVRMRINRFPSRGVLRRLYDAVAVRLRSARIRHVLGDVHYLAWFLPRRGTVLTILDCVSLERLSGWRRRLFWLLWFRWPSSRASHITVISEFGREALARYLDLSDMHVHVVPPPLSHEFMAMAPVAGPLRLLQVGTHPNKNVDRVIEAVAGLPIVLAIIGPLTTARRRRLDALGIQYESMVDLTREALVDQYRRSHALVFASTYEGFGLPIIEAQAIGRPVVTSEVSSMPEAAGGAACLVDPLDVQSIRRGIRRVTEDAAYAADLVQRGYANAARYAPQRIAERYAALYRSIDKAQTK